MPPTGSHVISLRSRATCIDHETAGCDDYNEDDNDSPARTPAGTPNEPGTNKRKRPPSNDSSGESPIGKRRTPVTSEPTRQYCTQACLLGHKPGRDLDDNCLQGYVGTVVVEVLTLLEAQQASLCAILASRLRGGRRPSFSGGSVSKTVIRWRPFPLVRVRLLWCSCGGPRRAIVDVFVFVVPSRSLVIFARCPRP